MGGFERIFVASRKWWGRISKVKIQKEGMDVNEIDFVEIKENRHEGGYDLGPSISHFQMIKRLIR